MLMELHSGVKRAEVLSVDYVRISAVVARQ